MADEEPVNVAGPKRSNQLASSAIPFAEYDPATEEMTVTFSNGQSYTHSGVSEEEYDAFVLSPSPGRTWWSVFKGR
jgi:KTSC domain